MFPRRITVPTVKVGKRTTCFSSRHSPNVRSGAQQPTFGVPSSLVSTTADVPMTWFSAEGRAMNALFRIAFRWVRGDRAGQGGGESSAARRQPLRRLFRSSRVARWARDRKIRAAEQISGDRRKLRPGQWISLMPGLRSASGTTPFVHNRRSAGGECRRLRQRSGRQRSAAHQRLISRSSALQDDDSQPVVTTDLSVAIGASLPELLSGITADLIAGADVPPPATVASPPSRMLAATLDSAFPLRTAPRRPASRQTVIQIEMTICTGQRQLSCDFNAADQTNASLFSRVAVTRYRLKKKRTVFAFVDGDEIWLCVLSPGSSCYVKDAQYSFV